MAARPTKIAVLGAEGVGKTALVDQFSKNAFDPSHIPTIEDAVQQQVVVDGEVYHLVILDTGGSQELETLNHQHIDFADGFLLVFALGDIQSMESASHFNEKIQTRKGRATPIVVVGNKADRLDCGFGAANIVGFDPDDVIPTSAKSGQNVELAFHTLIRRMRDHKLQSRPDASSSSSTMVEERAPRTIKKLVCSWFNFNKP